MGAGENANNYGNGDGKGMGIKLRSKCGIGNGNKPLGVGRNEIEKDIRTHVYYLEYLHGWP